MEPLKKEDIGSLEITRYDFKFINGEPKIVIEQVKILGHNGEYIRFAKLSGLTEKLASFPVKFKQKGGVKN